MPKKSTKPEQIPEEVEDHEEDEDDEDEDGDELFGGTNLTEEDEAEIKRLTEEISKAEGSGNKEELVDLLSKVTQIQCGSDNVNDVGEAVQNLEKEIQLRKELKHKEKLYSAMTNLCPQAGRRRLGCC